MIKNKKFLSIALASVLTVSVLTPFGKVTAETVSEGTVTANALTVRTGPSANYTAVDWLKKGEKVTIIKDHGAFSYVEYRNKKGYVHDSYLSIVKKGVSSASPTTSSKVGTVTASVLTVRSGPSANYAATNWINKGTKVTILKDHGTFSYVQFGSKKGYVHDGYLKITTVSTPVVTPVVTPNPVQGGSNTVHTVKAGETLWRISVNYKTTVANIKSLNGLSSDIIKVGQKLKVNGTSNTPVTQTPVQQSGKLKGKKITIDPGHGGKFPGAQGIVHEEDINLQIAFKLRDALKSQGATVIMTRTSDVHLASDRPSDLVARAKMSSGSDMFISIHGNAGTSTASGTEVYWYKGNGNSLASSIVKEISKETGLRNRGAKHADFSVLRNSGNQSVLVETAFVTNKNDAALLGSKSGQDKIVKGITKGILNYLGK